MTVTTRASGNIPRGPVTVELDDIQATVLRYRPEPYYGTHVLLRVDDARAGRDLLRNLTPHVASAADWWRAAEPWIAVGLTYSGMAARVPSRTGHDRRGDGPGPGGHAGNAFTCGPRKSMT